MLYRNSMLKLFKSLRPQGICMKLVLYIIYIKMHKTILHNLMKMNDLLDIINGQDHSDDQLDQVLQTYQAYEESQSQSQSPTRQLNAHITYHVLKQIKQSMVL